MDQRKIKIMTMHKAVHPRDDSDRLYVSRRESRGGHIDTTTRKLDRKTQGKTC